LSCDLLGPSKRSSETGSLFLSVRMLKAQSAVGLRICLGA
jgi:hypothetical protein